MMNGSRSHGYGQRMAHALMGGWGQGAGNGQQQQPWRDRPISSLAPQRQERMTSRWGVIGGGQPMPTTLGGYRDARRAWHQAQPPGSRGFGFGRIGRIGRGMMAGDDD